MNPGSDEAIAAGCICPILDNGHGKGVQRETYTGRIITDWWINDDCPIHRRKPEPPATPSGKE
jgi:hypothetical protein